MFIFSIDRLSREQPSVASNVHYNGLHLSLHAVIPPSMVRTAPVVYELSGPRRNAIIFAASSTVPILFIGVDSEISFLSCSLLLPAPTMSMGVSTVPGATQFTLILFAATSLAADLVRPMILISEVSFTSS